MPVGRPKKIQFPPNDQVMRDLFALLEEKVFRLQGKKTNKEKAEYLEELALEYNVPNLASSELKDHLISPYLKGSNIELSKEYGNHLYDLLQKIKEPFKFTEQLEVLENFRQRVNQSVTISHQPLHLPVLHSLKAKPSLSYLENTEWLIFERMGDQPIEGAIWGLGVSKLFFKSDGGYLGVEMHSNYEQLERKHVGIASADTQLDYLFIDMVMTDNSGKRANLVLRLADTDTEHQSTMIGHYTYHSRRYKHLLSKTVVLQQIIGHVQTGGPSLLADLKSGEYLYSDPEYKKTPIEIRQFLYSREMNRMSFPDTIISDLSELEKFHKNHREEKLNTVLLNSFCNDYFVYYKHSDGTITEDDLSLSYNEEAILIEASFLHQTDLHGKNIKTWMGVPIINEQKRAISIKLNDAKNITHQEDDPILITFWLPDVRMHYDYCECFPGLISGLEDATKEPIGFICLVVRKDIVDFKGKIDERLHAFFASNTFLEMAPRNIQFKLDDFISKR